MARKKKPTGGVISMTICLQRQHADYIKACLGQFAALSSASAYVRALVEYDRHHNILPKALAMGLTK